MNNPTPTPWGTAISHRLNQLGKMPVELDHLRNRIEAEIPRSVAIHLPTASAATGTPTAPLPSAATAASTATGTPMTINVLGATNASSEQPDSLKIDSPTSPRLGHAWVVRRMWQAVAALVVIGIGLSIILVSLQGGPAMASTAMLVELHNDLASGRVPQMTVTSMDQANAMLAAEHAGTPAMPSVDCDRVMSCCIHQVGQKSMATAMLMKDGQPVTLAVAQLDQMRPPEAQVRVIDGQTFHISSAQGVQMVMKIEQGRWICLMGKLPVETLAQMAQSVDLSPVTSPATNSTKQH